MNKTKIEYLDYTWNPIAMRCTPVSEGCRNCWHLVMAKRLANNPMIDEDRHHAYMGGTPLLIQEELEAPLHLKKPARIGVQFMGDLFHEAIPEDFIKSAWDIMQRAQTCGHTFFILTKRASRMQEVLKTCRIPVYNIWLGVSCEDQKTADKRIPILLQILAAHRWVSVEPMLGSVDLDDYFYHGKGRYEDTSGGQRYHLWDQTINWVVVGGETGPGARPLDPGWVESLRDQCQAAGVPFFFKSWGDYNRRAQGLQYVSDSNNSGHLIDGKEWREFPK